ncbi:4Fe-4S single cluster domain-containing protein [Spiroplasma clarkii]|uniref:Anaerobic ribonucleoside-triphosphate reductase-activating protein n=1 Tax=Spiroplasma clarkii TaxID=2139 RepID=A0A2K8KIK6_9MOLU|nr:4Fe-4S single cluster domain-containing protein [Spiroplasma clarkii]ATX71507.1 thiol peroxidase [Spiroplasma clarkii]
MSNINIAKFLTNSSIEGPGSRFVIWFQGCKLNCRGCSNQEMLPLEKKFFVPTSLILEKILESKEKYDLEGITLLGGEPFLQPTALKEIIDFCHKINLTIICFTGYLYENIYEEYQEILNKIDILIDGPFLIRQLDRTRRLIGSKNQRVLKLTTTYQDNDYFEQPHSEVEVQIYKNRVYINGDGVVFDNEVGEFWFKLD